MKCPNCGSYNVYCNDSRLTGDQERWRRRKCKDCGEGFYTMERLYAPEIGAGNPRTEEKTSDRSAEQRILDNGYEDVTILADFGYDDALVGVTTDNRAVYDFDRMVAWLIEHEEFSEEDAVEWIDYNTIRALPYAGPGGPIIVYPLRD